MEPAGCGQTVTSGPQLFFRFAQPPNRLGYCGPERESEIAVAASGEALPIEESTELALAFHGAWPYLEVIGALTGRDPLSTSVVEAYWLGNGLLQNVDLLQWGQSVSDRFRVQAGARWPYVAAALDQGGVPNHSFHVFCVYPWVGLLREGYVGPAVEVLDRCRISAGRVVGVERDIALVSRRPLVWGGDDQLIEAGPVEDPFLTVEELSPGDVVALHWDYVCQRISPNQLRSLRTTHDRHLGIANSELRRARVEPAR